MRGRREAGLGSLSALLAADKLDAALKRGGVKKLKTRKVLAAALAQARGERDNGATLAEVAGKSLKAHKHFELFQDINQDPAAGVGFGE